MPSPRTLLTVMLLLRAATLVAGIQRRDYVGSLTDTGQQWCFAERGGEPVLVMRNGFKRAKSWTISAPTILYADQNLTAAEGGRVVFGKPKEAGTQWTFEIVEHITRAPNRRMASYSKDKRDTCSGPRWRTDHFEAGIWPPRNLPTKIAPRRPTSPSIAP